MFTKNRDGTINYDDPRLIDVDRSILFGSLHTNGTQRAGFDLLTLMTSMLLTLERQSIALADAIVIRTSRAKTSFKKGIDECIEYLNNKLGPSALALSEKEEERHTIHHFYKVYDLSNEAMFALLRTNPLFGSTCALFSRALGAIEERQREAVINAAGERMMQEAINVAISTERERLTARDAARDAAAAAAWARSPASSPVPGGAAAAAAGGGGAGSGSPPYDKDASDASNLPMGAISAGAGGDPDGEDLGRIREQMNAFRWEFNVRPAPMLGGDHLLPTDEDWQDYIKSTGMHMRKNRTRRRRPKRARRTRR